MLSLVLRMVLLLVLAACGDDVVGTRPDAGGDDVGPGDSGTDADRGPAPVDDAGADAGNVGPLTFHCAPTTTECPEVRVQGDPPTTYPQHPFHGYGDPSLEADETGRLWLAYSWLDTTVSPGTLVDFTVRTHLARSDDGGRSFTFVRAANEIERRAHWDDGTRSGIVEHEVSTLVREPSGSWQLLWLDYFDELGDGPMNRSDFFFSRARAATPEELGDTIEPWIRGSAATASVGAPHVLSSVAGLEDCLAFTEPGLVAAEGSTWLAAGCLWLESGELRDRLVLLRETPDGYQLAGTLLDGADGARLGADRMEQADLAFARDGSLLLFVTPIVAAGDPMHQGCVVYDVEDLATARLRRDASGAPIARAVITADGNGLGPGLCTYDAASETGVLLVITRFDLDATPPSLAFTMHATGLHP